MMDWLYLCSGLAVLLLSENERSDPGDKTLSWYLGTCLRDGLEILGQSVPLLLAYSFLLGVFQTIGWQKELSMVFFLIAPYGISRLIRQKGSLFLVVFIFCGWAAYSQPQPDAIAAVSSVCSLTAIFVLFELLFIGVRRRLLFSKVPKAAAGLPVLLVVAAILTWAFGALGAVLF